MNASDIPEVSSHSGLAKPQLGTVRQSARTRGPGRLRQLRAALSRESNALIELLKIPPPLTAQVLQRIEMMEQHIILPIKAAWIAILLRPANYSWIGEQATNLEINPAYAYCLFWIYVAVSVVVGLLILLLRRIPPALAEGAVFAIPLVDGI